MQRCTDIESESDSDTSMEDEVRWQTRWMRMRSSPRWWHLRRAQRRPGWQRRQGCAHVAHFTRWPCLTSTGEAEIIRHPTTDSADIKTWIPTSTHGHQH